MTAWRFQFVTFFLLFFSFLSGIVFFVFTQKIIDFSMLEHYNPGKPTILLDDDGNEWARFQLDRRDPVPLEQVPQHLIDAVLAAEDHDFFNHAGISWRGIIRSTIVNMYRGKFAQGASTITQQLVKLLFFDSRKTVERKIKEQFYSLIVEYQFTKEQILQTYLNHVYFGSGIYGVQAASQRFWGIPVNKISIDQAATLAAIIRSPVRYCPLQFPVEAQKRRDLILRSMANLNFITASAYDQAKQTPLKLTMVSSDDECAPHLKEKIGRDLEELFGRECLYGGGLLVQTTLNRTMQTIAKKSFDAQCEKMKVALSPCIDGALISMEVKTGQVKALIGGADFTASKFNRALQARRQMGSIFKTFVYASAIEQGKTFASTEVDEPLEIVYGKNVWKPQNNTLQFEGLMTLAYALSHSNNSVTIKTLFFAGCDRVKELGEKCRIPGLQPYPSIALGCVDITLKEAIAAFNVFANHGVYVEPYWISWVKDEWGNKIYKHKSISERVMPALVTDQVAKVLGIGIETKRRQLPEKWLDSQAFGKTGTTNDCRTCWYCGSTPEITTAVYVGCDDNRSLGHDVYANRTSFPIWFGLHKNISSTQKEFSYDASLQERLINLKTGERAYDLSDPNNAVILVPGNQ